MIESHSQEKKPSRQRGTLLLRALPAPFAMLLLASCASRQTPDAIRLADREALIQKHEALLKEELESLGALDLQECVALALKHNRHRTHKQAQVF